MLFTKATYAELRQGYTNRNGFIFTALTDPANVHDAIVVHVPQSAGCITPQLPHSSRSFAEHLALIQSEGLEKAIVISCGSFHQTLRQTDSIFRRCIICHALNGFAVKRPMV